MKFRILRPLAAGGHGEVFLGQLIPTGQAVVIKYPRHPDQPDVRRRFAREVRILGRRVRGLVTLLGFDTDGDRPCYVMPFLQNGSIAQYRGRLSQGQLFVLAADVASALAGLHVENIAHGDVKPDNALITDERRVVLSDPLGNGWGCTVVFADHHGGTPGYWAPEIRVGGAISPAGDMYSYGVMLHELATGTRPTDGVVPEMTAIEPLDPRLREVIASCCSVAPGDRPSAKDIAALLRGEAWKSIRQARAYRNLGLGIAAAIAMHLFAE